MGSAAPTIFASRGGSFRNVAQGQKGRWGRPRFDASVPPTVRKAISALIHLSIQLAAPPSFQVSRIIASIIGARSARPSVALAPGASRQQYGPLPGDSAFTPEDELPF